MDHATDYQCAAYGYAVDFMVSGYDRGFEAHVHAVSCADCGELHVARLPIDADGRVDRPRGGRPGEIDLTGIPLQCPVAAAHQVVPWYAPGPCPRCGATLEGGDALILWD